MVEKESGWDGWSRAIILVDMNAFFASIEQLDNPALRGRPVVVTNGEQGTCIITSSYGARRYGIKTGMRLPEAKRLCPHLVRAPSRPGRYAKVSSRIMEALRDVTPDQEIFSVDECFLDISHCRTLYATPVDAAHKAKQCVLKASGLLCSVGLGGDKTMAKFAAKQQKPDGLTVIPPWQSAQRLAHVPVQALCGIGPGITAFLARYGVHVCGDMARLPVSVLGKRYGNLGRRLWCMCQGRDFEPLHLTVPDPKSIGHGKVLPPGCDESQAILAYFYRMALKVAARLRDHQLSSRLYFIGMKTDAWGWLGGRYQLPTSGQDGLAIYALAKQCCRAHPHHGVVRQIQLTALRPEPMFQQGDLFTPIDAKQQQCNHLLDAVQQRFGHDALVPASLLDHQLSPDVIAPAWRPDGVRCSVMAVDDDNG